MRTGLATLIICLLILPVNASAGRYHSAFRGAIPPAAIAVPGHGKSPAVSTTRRHGQLKIGRHPLKKRFKAKPGTRRKPVHPIYPGHKPGKPNRPPFHGRPHYWWPATTTVVKEVPTVIIVQPPPPAAPEPPKPKEIWVPPVLGLRTEPGYWDYGVKKIWMGDHWRYEQDVTSKTWVPESQVKYVQQAGYWKVVE